MLKNTNHDIMPCAEKSAHLASRVMVIDGQSAFVGVTPANRASVVLGCKSFFVPLWRNSVASLKFFAPSFGASLIRSFVGVCSFLSAISQAVPTLIFRVLSADGSLFFKSSHNVSSYPTAYGCQLITP